MEHHLWTALGEAQRYAWEAKPGGVAIAAGPGVELQKAPLTSARGRALHDTGHHVKGDRVVHVGFTVWARRCRRPLPKNAEKRAVVEGHFPVPGRGWEPCPS